MRYSSAGLLLLLLSGTVFAQTTVPFTFTAGTAAKASEVNADFQALANAIDNLASRVTKLEGLFTSTDIAGTWALRSFEIGTDNSIAGTPDFGGFATIRSAHSTGNLTLNTDGTFTLSGTKNSTQVTLIYQKTPPGIFHPPPPGSPPGTPTEQERPQVDNLTAIGQGDAQGQSASGTWSISGNVLTLNAGDSLSFNRGGPNLFINVSVSGSTHIVTFLMRIGP